MEKQKTEREKLDEEMRNIIEEARVIVPGMQALFGFQTIAVFNDRFADLELFARACHTLGLGMVVIAIAMPKCAMCDAEQKTTIARGTVLSSRSFIELDGIS